MDYGQTRCVPTEDGLAKIERISPMCLNGKKLDEEWVRFSDAFSSNELLKILKDNHNTNSWLSQYIFQRDGNLLKTCVIDKNMADASQAIVVVKSCVVGDATLQVGEERYVVGRVRIRVTASSFPTHSLTGQWGNEESITRIWNSSGGTTHQSNRTSQNEIRFTIGRYNCSYFDDNDFLMCDVIIETYISLIATILYQW